MAKGADAPPSGPRAAEQPDRLLSEVLEAVCDGVAVFDEDATLVCCNGAFRALNPALAGLVQRGIAWEMLLREAVQRSALPPAGADRLRRMEEDLAKGRESVEPIELDLPSGSVHEFAMRPTTAGGFIVTQRDTTKSRLYEATDREADMLLRKVLEACPANVVMSRIGDGQILYRSPAATELFGNARRYYDHFASREERADFITALLPDGRVDNVQITGIRADGTLVPCSVSARLIEYRGEDVVVSSTLDISKEVELQKRLAAQRERVFETEKMSALGELLAGVAHELNNPLSVVVGHALMMREEMADHPDALRRLSKIGDAAERCARIVKSFLAMARQMPARLAPMNLAETIAGAIEALSQSASGLASTVDVEVPPDLPPVLGDADQIEQVFINLLTNADQAIAGAGIAGRIVVSARLDAAEGMVEVRVADNGPGVPEAIRSRIFHPLFTTKDAGKGTGIGLAFCHRVAISHNGQIFLEPGSGRGATFVLRLPTAADAPDTANAAEVESGRPAPARILVVDDEADVAELIREILERDGLSVDHALSGEAALQRLAGGAYQLVLTDLNMPGLGGRGFYEAAIRENPALARRIAFVTGDTMSPSARGFLDGAGCPYLEKPIAPAELRALVRRMVDASGDETRFGANADGGA